MSKQAEPVDTIEGYLQHRLGISHLVTNAFLKAVTEWISIKLRKREVAVLPYIGKITLKITPKCKKLNYTPGISLRNRIDSELGKESFFKLSLDSIKEKLGLTQYKVNQQVQEELEEELRTDRRVIIKNEQDLLRHNMLYYYQRHYPHSMDWIHPVTKKRYSWQDMSGALALIKTYSWKDYRLLLTTLLSIGYRRKLLLKWKLSKSDYYRSLYKSLDSILMLLECPKLSSDELRSILETDYFRI